MSVEIPADLQPFVQQVIASGLFANEQEVICESLRLLQDRERNESLRNDVQIGLDELDRGERIDGEEIFRELEEKAESLRNKGR